MSRKLVLSLIFLLSLPILLTSSESYAIQELPPQVEDVIADFDGEIYFAAKELSSERLLGYRANEQVKTASVIKVAIMAEAFAQAKSGKISLDSRLTLRKDDQVPGAGILQDLRPGAEFTLRDAITLMIVLSDNTATNMVIDKVGIERVNASLEKMGLRKTFLNKKVFKAAPPELSEQRARWGLGSTTPLEMLQLLEAIVRNELVDAESCAEMISIMEKNRDLDQIPRYLFGSDWRGVSVAHKSGALNQVRNDVGIVSIGDKKILLSLFAQQSKDEKWTPDNAASVALARLAHVLLETFR